MGSLKKKDPRVYDWPFMSDPWKTLGLISLYLYCICFSLPSYMANKKAYSLKGIIRIYNVFEIVSNVIIIYGLACSGWSANYTLGCQTIDYSEDEMALRMATYMWWIAMIKMVQLMETVLFVLRKKLNQVTFLHVYHHASTALLAWILAKYFPGGMASFVWLINSFVHVLMYTYYLLSSFGPEIQKKLVQIKLKLTLLQIVQLILIIVHAAQSLFTSCQVSSMFGFIVIVDISIDLYYFIKFYMKNIDAIKKNV